MFKNTAAGLILIMFFIQGCGVKTDPIPPVSPAEIGRGAPLYKSKKLDAPEKKSKKKPPQAQDNEEE